MNALDLDKLDDKFDFILEWALLHSIMKEDRAKYVENINKILNENGKYFSVCFNEKSPKFGGPRQGERIIPEGARALVGSKLYFSSLDELKDLFNKYFDIIESKVFQHEAGGAISFLNYFFMEKK